MTYSFSVGDKVFFRNSRAMLPGTIVEIFLKKDPNKEEGIKIQHIPISYAQGAASELLYFDIKEAYSGKVFWAYGSQVTPLTPENEELWPHEDDEEDEEELYAKA